MSTTRMPMPILMAMHPGNPHGLRFAGGDGGESGEGQPAPKPTEEQQGKQEHTFTQADVDRIVADRLKRERERYADYDDLKAKAGKTATAEERIAALEQQITQANITALRARIANQHGVAAEDADLFLTGSDEDTLTAQAQRLAERESERKRNGNTVPREGTNPPPADDKDAQARAFFGIT